MVSACPGHRFLLTEARGGKMPSTYEHATSYGGETEGITRGPPVSVKCQLSPVLANRQPDQPCQVAADWRRMGDSWQALPDHPFQCVPTHNTNANITKPTPQSQQPVTFPSVPWDALARAAIPERSSRRLREHEPRTTLGCCHESSVCCDRPLPALFFLLQRNQNLQGRGDEQRHEVLSPRTHHLHTTWEGLRYL